MSVSGSWCYYRHALMKCWTLIGGEVRSKCATTGWAWIRCATLEQKQRGERGSRGLGLEPTGTFSSVLIVRFDLYLGWNTQSVAWKLHVLTNTSLATLFLWHLEGKIGPCRDWQIHDMFPTMQTWPTNEPWKGKCRNYVLIHCTEVSLWQNLTWTELKPRGNTENQLF